MTTIAEIRQFVNDQRSFHDRKANRFLKTAERQSGALKVAYEKRARAHQDMIAKFAEIGEFIDTRLGDAARPAVQPIASSGLALTPQDIEGLPPELVEELSISEADMADFAILKAVEDSGGVLSLDKILISLYKKTGEINKRTAINSRIYRMVQRGSMFSVPGKKGVYSTRELSEDEAAALQ